jgi:hypothetical protein
MPRRGFLDALQNVGLIGNARDPRMWSAPVAPRRWDAQTRLPVDASARPDRPSHQAGRPGRGSRSRSPGIERDQQRIGEREAAEHRFGGPFARSVQPGAEPRARRPRAGSSVGVPASCAARARPQRSHPAWATFAAGKARARKCSSRKAQPREPGETGGDRLRGGRREIAAVKWTPAARAVTSSSRTGGLVAELPGGVIRGPGRCGAVSRGAAIAASRARRRSRRSLSRDRRLRDAPFQAPSAEPLDRNVGEAAEPEGPIRRRKASISRRRRGRCHRERRRRGCCRGGGS